MDIRKVCVYCASSSSCRREFFGAAERLGRELAQNDVTIVYGGGARGLMGALADSALQHGGRVIGVLPHFMSDLEWGHCGLTELRLVNDIHERKRLLIQDVDAVVALPGGCGTLEELFEAITLKRLGLFTKPIVLLNTAGFFDACLQLLEKCIAERFMDDRHRAIWQVTHQPEEVLSAIRSAAPWSHEARRFAAL